MKRIRPTIWISLCLLVFLAAVFVWQKTLERRILESSEGAPQAALVPAPPAVSAPPVAAPSKGASSVVSFYGSIPGSTVNPAVVGAHATKRNPHRISNTDKKFEELIRRDHAILLRNAYLDTEAPVRGLPIPDELRAGRDAGAYLVQSRGGITPGFLRMLRESGASFAPGAYIPNNTYVVRADPAAAKRIQNSGLVHKVLPYEPFYKLDTTLLDYAMDRMPPPFGGRMRVTLFPGEREKTMEILAGSGTQILSEEQTPLGPSLIVLPNIPTWTELAMMPEVQLVERYLDKVLMNDLTRTRLHISTNTTVPDTHLGLTGAGQWVGVADANGMDTAHPDLTPRAAMIPVASTSDPGGHMTFVAGIIGSSGAGSPSVTPAGPSGQDKIPGSTNAGANFRGMAPAVEILGIDINLYSDTELSEIPAHTNLFLLERTNTMILNNSWGYSNVRTYDSSAAIWDARTRDALPAFPGMQQTLPVFSVGNSGFGASSGQGGLSDRIHSPATFKNGISVGASESLRDITNEFAVTTVSVTNTCITNMTAIYLGRTDSSNQVASFSSRGNVDPGDEGPSGRFKPDVVAPGGFPFSLRSGDWDAAARYAAGAVDDIDTYFTNITIAPDMVQTFAFLIPFNATNFLIDPRNQLPTGFELRVYTNNAPLPSVNPAFLAGTNLTSFEVTGQAAGLWYVDIENTNAGVEITFDLLMRATVTNCASDSDTVLEMLNDTADPSGDYRFATGGTSYAAPAVSGLLALIQEFFEGTTVLTDPLLRRTNSAAMMKAILINSARSLSQAYDYNMGAQINYQGWGLPSIRRAIPEIMGTETDTNRWPIQMYDQTGSNSLATDFAHGYNIAVDSTVTNVPLRITVAWTDPPGNPAAAVKLVNDINILLSNNLTGDIYLGNTFDGNGDFSDIVSPTNDFLDPTTGMPLEGDVPTNDVVNNVENIYLNAPLQDDYTLYVVGNRINVSAVSDHTNDVTQDYALVVSCGEVAGGLTITGLPTSPDPTIVPTVIPNFFSADTNEPHRYTSVDVMDTNGVATANHRAGANSALIGETNTVAVNGMTSYGTTNQWVFFVVTNNVPAIEGATRGLFATYRPQNLSEPRNDDADVDLYVSTNPALTNLDEAVVTASLKSQFRGGTEFVVVNGSAPGSVYYIGVKSEDQMAVEFGFFARFFTPPPDPPPPPFNTYIEGFPVPIPDGTPQMPGGSNVFFFNFQPMDIRRVTVTNLAITHQLMGDLVAELVIENGQGDDIPRATIFNHRNDDARLGRTYIIDDSEEGNVTYPATPATGPLAYHNPGGAATRSDGPRTLDSFVGADGFGMWRFIVSDNQLIHTGLVNGIGLWLEPLNTDDVFDDDFMSTPRRVQVCGGNSWVDAVNVPPGAISFTIQIDIIGAGGPLDLFVRRDEAPTTNVFDHTAVIQNPGGSLTITIGDDPALNPGRYFVRIRNPNTVGPCVDFDLSYDGEIDFGVVPKVTEFNSTQMTLLDDTRTNSLTAQIPVAVSRQVTGVRAGFRIDHERASDLSIRLVSPSGTDVLLAENRGRWFTNGYGFGSDPGEIAYVSFSENADVALTPIKFITDEAFMPMIAPKVLATNWLEDAGWTLNTDTTAGSSDESVFLIPVGINSGDITITYDFASQPDRLEIYERSGGVLSLVPNGDTGVASSLTTMSTFPDTAVDTMAETITIVGNPYIDNDRIVFVSPTFPPVIGGNASADLPAPLSHTTFYRVRNVVGDSFELEEEVSGNAVDLTSQGAAGATHTAWGGLSTPSRSFTVPYTTADGLLEIVVNQGSGTPGTGWDYSFTLSNPAVGAFPAAAQVGTGITAIDGRIFVAGHTAARAENGVIAQFSAPLSDDGLPFYSLNWPDLRGGTRFNDVAATSVGVFAVGNSYTQTQDPDPGLDEKERKSIVARFAMDDPAINVFGTQGADFHRQIPDTGEGLFSPHGTGGTDFDGEEEAHGIASTIEGGVEVLYITGTAPENAGNPSRMFLSKMDTAGDFIWHTNDLYNMTANGLSAGYDVTARDNEVFVAGANADSGTIDPYVMAMDSSGVELWTYTHPGVGQFNAITTLGDAVYAVGVINALGGVAADALVVKLDRATGANIWTWTDDQNGDEDILYGILPYGNRVYTVGTTGSAGNPPDLNDFTGPGPPGAAVINFPGPNRNVRFDAQNPPFAPPANNGIPVVVRHDAGLASGTAAADWSASIPGALLVRYNNNSTTLTTLIAAVNALPGGEFTASILGGDPGIPIAIPGGSSHDGIMYEIGESGTLITDGGSYTGVTLYDAMGSEEVFRSITTDGFDVYVAGSRRSNNGLDPEDVLLIRYQVKDDILPEESLREFIGESSGGNWRLDITDGRTGGDTNVMSTLLSWQLQLDLAVTNRTPFPLTDGNMITGDVVQDNTRYFVVHVPFTASQATIDVSSPDGGLIDLWFNQNSLPVPGLAFDTRLQDDVGVATATTVLQTANGTLVPGQRFFLAIENDDLSETHDFTIEVTFDSTATTFSARGSGSVAGSVPAPSTTTTTDIYQFNVYAGEPRVHFDVKDLTGDIVLRLRNGAVPDSANFDIETTITGVNYHRTTLEPGTPLPAIEGTWFASIQNAGADAVAYEIEVIGENAPPLVTAISDLSINEDEGVSLSVDAIDPNTPLIYTMPVGPFGASIDTQSGVFSWSPSEAHGPGVHPVTIVVTDSGIPPLGATQTFNVAVSELNSAPTLPAFGSPLVDEGSLLTLVGTATDSDIPANNLHYELTQAPSGAAISPSLGVITWTPDESDGGQPHVFSVTVTDDGNPSASASATFNVGVAELNNPPTLAAIEDASLLELTSLQITCLASDSDLPANQLIFSFESAPPAGMTLDPITGVLDWTPSEAQGPGVYAIGVVVTDNGAPNKSAIQRFNVTVTEQNLPPVIAPVGNQTVDEGVELAIMGSATDADLPKQALSYSLVGAPAGMTIDASSGAISWTPTEAQGPNTYSVELVVSDGATPPLTDSTTFDIQVNEVNAAPTVTPLPDLAVDEGAVISFTAVASDSDLPANNIAFSLGSGSPAGATLDPITGEFNWIVDESQGPGVYTIGILAGDDGAPPLAGGVSFTVVVDEVNSAPNLVALPVQTVVEGGSIGVALSVIDLDEPRNRIVYSLEPGAPSGAVINPDTGVLNWTSSEVNGTVNLQIAVRATDDGNPILSDTGVVDVTIIDGNTAPLLTPIGGKSISEGSTLAFDVTASDSDLPEDMLIFSLVSAPVGAAIDPISGAFSWTPTEAQGSAVQTVTVEVTDNGSPALTHRRSFTISVGDVNQPPTLDVVADATVAEGASLIVDLSASDSDVPANSLLYSIEAPSPAGVTVNPVSGRLVWAPSEEQGPGSHVITVKARDNGSPVLSDTRSFNVMVEEVNQKPVLDEVGDVPVNEGTPLRIEPTATDGDIPGNSLMFSLDPGAPEGMTIDPFTGVIDWETGETDGPDDYPITIRVTDNGAGALEDFETLTVSVREVNTPPTLGAIGNGSVNELQSLGFDASATDADIPANGFSFSLAGDVPQGASIHPGTGVFEWTPTEGQGPGVYEFDVVVSDNGAPVASDRETIAITVAEQNVAPAITPVGDRMIPEGEAYSLLVGASDADQPANDLTFTVEPGAPAGLAIDPNSGELAWTPGEDLGGQSFPVTVRVTDNGDGPLSVTDSFMLHVVDNNSAPDLAAIETQTVNEGATLNLELAAADPDDPADQLTFTLEPGAPAGMSIHPGSGAISWTPGEDQGPDSHPVTVRVTDNGDGLLSDTESFTVTVAEVNTAPEIAAIGDRTGNEGVTLSLTASATDSDEPANQLAYSLDPGAPAGMSINASSGAISWTPMESQGPGSFEVVVRATDNGEGSLSAATTFTVNVDEVNTAPMLAAIANRNVEEGVQLAVTASASDIDLPANQFAYSLAGDVPTGAAIHPESGLFTWTPGENHGGGDYVITVVVSDDASDPLEDTEIFVVTVSDSNSAPVLAAIADRSIEEGSPLVVTASATDSDDPADEIAYSLDPGAPAGMSIDSESGEINWTPTEAQGPGEYAVTVRATDNGEGSLSDSATFSIDVAEDNTAPVLAAIGDRSGDEGVALSFAASATDADEPTDALAFSLDPGAPAAAAIHPTTGLFSWTPGEADGPGTFEITIRVTDDGDGSLSDSETISVTVNEVNTAPSLAAIAELAGNEGTAIGTLASAVDSDLPANDLTFSLAPGAPVGLMIDPASGQLEWTPTEAQGPESYEITVVVSDDGDRALTDSTTFTLQVDEVNLPPTLDPISSRTVSEGTAVSFTASASDTDDPANLLTYTLDPGAPAGATIDPNSGDFTWTPSEAQGPETFTIVVRVTDNGVPSLSATQAFTVQVDEANQAPRLAAISNQTVRECDTLSLAIFAIDDDQPVQSLSFSLGEGAPEGASIDAATGSFTFNAPGGAQSYEITVVVADDATPSLSASRTFTVIVNELTISLVTLANGEAVEGTASSCNSFKRYYRFTAPAGTSRALFELYDLSADADLLLRKGDVPSVEVNDAVSSTAAAGSEKIVVPLGGSGADISGVWYLAVQNQTAGKADFKIRATVPVQVDGGSMLISGEPIEVGTAPIVSADENPTINFAGVQGEKYVIEVSDDLISWTVLTEIIISDSSASVVDPTPYIQQTKRFYRIRQVAQ